MESDNTHSTAKQDQVEREQEEDRRHEQLVKDQGGFVEMKETIQKAAEEAGTNFDTLVNEAKTNAEATLETIQDVASVAKEKAEKAGGNVAQETKKDVEDASNRANEMAEQIKKLAEDDADDPGNAETEKKDGNIGIIESIKEEIQKACNAITGSSKSDKK